METVRGAQKTMVTFSTPSNVKLEGTINDQHLVEHIQMWVDNPVLGDMAFEAAFSDYKDFGGVKFPTRILQRSAGYPILDVTITDVKPNAAQSLAVPDNISRRSPLCRARLFRRWSRTASGFCRGTPRASLSNSLTTSSWWMAPETEARSLAAIDAVKKTIPGSPSATSSTRIRISTMPVVFGPTPPEGATIITHRDNVPDHEQVWANPRTINPDRLARSGRKATFEGIVGSRMLCDGSRTLAMLSLRRKPAQRRMLIIYLPKENILIEADSFTPPPNLTCRRLASPISCISARPCSGEARRRSDHPRPRPSHHSRRGEDRDGGVPADAIVGKVGASREARGFGSEAGLGCSWKERRLMAPCKKCHEP